MRFLMKVTCPLEPFNSYVRDGSIGARMGKVMEDIKPEAAYFTAEKGCRGGTLVVHVDNPSKMPSLAEPWFLMFNAKVELLPVMLPEELANAGLDSIGKKWS